MRSRYLVLLVLLTVACGTPATETETTVSASVTTVQDGTSTTASASATTDESASTTSLIPETTIVETTIPETTTTLSEVGTLEDPIPVGRVATVGDWSLRVVSVTPNATDAVMTENEFNDPPGDGEQFFMAALEATYQGDESSTFWLDVSLKAVGKSNVAYEAFEAGCGVIPDSIDDAGETFPGGTITGNTCWRIKKGDAQSMVMIAEETLSFEGVRAFLSLDPSATPEEGSTAGEATGGNVGEDAVALGKAGKVGPWRLKVTSVTPNATDAVMTENEFNDPPGDGEQFFMAALEATYQGDESSEFWLDVSLKAVGKSNVAYEAFEAGCGVIPDSIDEAGETFPGGKIAGNTCWRIKKGDAQSLVMIAEETLSFEGSRTFYKLSE